MPKNLVTSDLERGFRSAKTTFLSQLPVGSQGTVIDLATSPDLQGRLMGMGLFVGTRFQLLQGGEQSKWPLILAIGETRIALGPGVANMIVVE